jgi:hypothetical protein
MRTALVVLLIALSACGADANDSTSAPSVPVGTWYVGVCNWTGDVVLSQQSNPLDRGRYEWVMVRRNAQTGQTWLRLNCALPAAELPLTPQGVLMAWPGVGELSTDAAGIRRRLRPISGSVSRDEAGVAGNLVFEIRDATTPSRVVGRTEVRFSAQ